MVSRLGRPPRELYASGSELCRLERVGEGSRDRLQASRPPAQAPFAAEQALARAGKSPLNVPCGI